MPAPLPAPHKTKLEAVYVALKRNIESEIWKVGERIPTEVELARTFDCGRSTAGGAINRLVHDGLVERRTRVGTRVIRSSSPRGLLPRSTEDRSRLELDAVAFIYSSELHGGIFRMVQGFQLEARRRGRRVINLSTGTDHHKEAEFISRLAEFDVKGAVFCPLASSVEEELLFSRAIHQSKLPIVLTSALAGSLCPSVLVDNFRAGYESARHLISKGVRDIGFVANGAMCSYVRGRYQGFCWALREAGLPVSPRYVLLREERQINFEDPLAEPRELCRRYLATVERGLEAVVCADRYLAVGMVHAALDKGLKVPRDIKIVGMGDDALRPPGGVTLTTYTVPYEELGREAFRLLDQVLNTPPHGPNPSGVLVGGHLIVGSSSG